MHRMLSTVELEEKNQIWIRAIPATQYVAQDPNFRIEFSDISRESCQHAYHDHQHPPLLATRLSRTEASLNYRRTSD